MIADRVRARVEKTHERRNEAVVRKILAQLIVDVHVRFIQAGAVAKGDAQHGLQLSG